MKRPSAGALVAVALALATGLTGCGQSGSPAAPVAGVDKARAVQRQSDARTSGLEQRIDGMTP